MYISDTRSRMGIVQVHLYTTILNDRLVIFKFLSCVLLVLALSYSTLELLWSGFSTSEAVWLNIYMKFLEEIAL